MGIPIDRFNGRRHVASILAACLGFCLLLSLSACQGIYKGEAIPFSVSYVEEWITVDESAYHTNIPVLISTTEDLAAYYDPSTDPGWQERELSGDVNDFVVATERYDDDFFAAQSLILIDKRDNDYREPPWKITSVNRDGDTVTITASVPSVPPGTIQTTEEARWTTFIEVAKTDLPEDATLEVITES